MIAGIVSACDQRQDAAVFVYPSKRLTGVDPAVPLEWTSVDGAEAYALQVGTEPGAKDLIDTGEIAETWFAARSLPAGVMVYATLRTKSNGAWLESKRDFLVESASSRFEYPRDGDLQVVEGRPFQWEQVEGAAAYRLAVSTRPGLTDIYEGGETQAISANVDSPPLGSTLYARLSTLKAGTWRYEDVRFRAEGSPFVPAEMLFPEPGARLVSVNEPFRWSTIDLASAYRLQIGTQPGEGDVHDSGEVTLGMRVVEGLPLSTPLFGSLHTEVDGTWYTTEFEFSANSNTVPERARIEAAFDVAHSVRTMADPANYPLSRTHLFGVVRKNGRPGANCDDYSETLLRILPELNAGLPARYLGVCFNTNLYECHSLVELFSAELDRWVLADPTFALTATRTSDSTPATAIEVSEAVAARDWTAIEFVPLGSSDLDIARAYYLDYPLLFLNVFSAGEQIVVGEGRSPLDYLIPMEADIVDDFGVYVVRCLEGDSVTVNVDGEDVDLKCNGVATFSKMFYASSVRTGAGSQTYRPRRFVF